MTICCLAGVVYYWCRLAAEPTAKSVLLHVQWTMVWTSSDQYIPPPGPSPPLMACGLKRRPAEAGRWRWRVVWLSVDQPIPIHPRVDILSVSCGIIKCVS